MLEEIITLERNMKLEFGKLLHKNTNHKCLYPNCNNDAILSHSISRLIHTKEQKLLELRYERI